MIVQDPKSWMSIQNKIYKVAMQKSTIISIVKIEYYLIGTDTCTISIPNPSTLWQNLDFFKYQVT